MPSHLCVKMTPSRSATTFSSTLRAGAASLHLPLAEPLLSACEAHYALLLEHNLRAGLTSLTDPTETAIKHYLDSLTCLLVRDLAPGETIADLGSGAGFPGMILAMARPEARFTLFDSSAKRAAFLRLAAAALHLDNVEVVTARAETAGQDPAHREHYDVVVSRALAPLPVLLEYCLPLTRLGGHMLAMKGPEASPASGGPGAELPGLSDLSSLTSPPLLSDLKSQISYPSLLGGHLTTTHHFELPQNAGSRTLLLFEKVAPTPTRYPRRPGIPAKRPLR